MILRIVVVCISGLNSRWVLRVCRLLSHFPVAVHHADNDCRRCAPSVPFSAEVLDPTLFTSGRRTILLDC